MLKGTLKPLRRRVLIEEGLAKSSLKKKKKKKSTWRTQTSVIFVKQVVFHTVNHCGPLPLKELHSTGETIVWRDPGDLEPAYHLFTIVCEITLPQAVTCGLPPKSILRREKH